MNTNISNTYFYLGIATFILLYMTKNVIYIGFVVMLLLFLYKNQKKYKKLLDNIVEIDDSDNDDQHYNDNIRLCLLLDKGATCCVLKSE